MLKPETKDAFFKAITDHDFGKRNQQNSSDILAVANAVWNDWNNEDQSVAMDYYAWQEQDRSLAPPNRYVKYWFDNQFEKHGFNVERLNELQWNA